MPEPTRPFEPISTRTEEVLCASTGQTRSREASSKVMELRETAVDKAEQVKQHASAVYEQAETKLNDTLNQGKRRTSELLRQARMRAVEIRQRYPLQIIVVSAAAGFLLGMFLRIRRARNYE